MLPPRKVQFEAQKRENENLRFRTFLKCNADEEKLDRQFKSVPLEKVMAMENSMYYTIESGGESGAKFHFSF